MTLDDRAFRAARGRGALELALGEALLKLFDGDRLLQLGYARQSDYARERLGVSVRSVHAWTALARGLASRSVLRRAVQAGRVSSSKALVVMEAATGEREAAWTAAAIGMSVSELERCVRAGGFDAAADSFEVESVVLQMTAEQQDRLDAALELAGEVVGPGSPRWQRLEAICQEWLGEFAGLDPDLAWRPREPLDVKPGLARHLGAPPHREDALPDSAEALDRYVRELLARRRQREEELGRALVAVLEARAYAGHANFEDYARERLGMSPRSAWQRVWLERRLVDLPALRAALAAGEITLTKAQILARAATPDNIEDLIAEARDTTCQQLDRDATEREDLQNRADGIRRLWGPTEAFETILFALDVAYCFMIRERNRWCSRGELLAAMADHFVEVWTVHRDARRVPRERRRVLGRHGGRCAVPGCSAPAVHEHHIVFRSQGGTDDLENRVALCAAHHLRGVHAGNLRVAGRAGKRLIWDFGNEAWVTEGDDDVRRVREEVPIG